MQTNESTTSKEKQTTSTLITKKMQLQTYLKQTPFAEILEKCPNFGSFIKAITEKLSI